MLNIVAIASFILGVYSVGYVLVSLILFLPESTKLNDSKIHILRFLFGWGSIFFLAGVASWLKISFGNCLLGLFLFCLIPLLVFFAKSISAKHPLLSRSDSPYICIAILLIVAAISTGLLAGVNSCDDPGRYFFLASRLWADGNLFDPFNNWRTTVPGGALVVQSIGLRLAGTFGPIALDVGSGTAILLVVGLVLKNWTIRIGMLLYCCFIALTNAAGILPANTTPRFLPVALMLGSLLILFDKDFFNANKGAAYPGVAMAIAACGTIRLQFLLFLGLTVLIFVFLNKPRNLRMLILIGVQTLFFLIPWLLGSLRDTGSAMFPVMKGNVDTDWIGNSLPSGASFPFLNRVLGIETLKFLIAAIAILLLCRIYYGVSISKQAKAILSSACVTLILFAYLAKANAQVDISRYLAPVVVCSVLLLICIEPLQKVQKKAKRFTSASMLACLLGLGITASDIGLNNIGEQAVKRLSSTARMVTSENRADSDLSNQRASINSLLSNVPHSSVILSSIDNTELTLNKVAHSFTVGLPGFVYPKPHEMSWSLGISPTSDVFEVKLFVSQLEIGEIYSLIQFGESGRADMIGIRRTPVGVQLALEHWGNPLTYSEPWTSTGDETSFRIEIDRLRGLVRKIDDTNTITMSILGGEFYDKDSKSPYFLGHNTLGFSTLADTTPAFLSDAVSLMPTRQDEFYTSILKNLKMRKVGYLLIQRPASSICLYNEANWKANAVSETLYENQSEYFFAWFDFGYELQKQSKGVFINGDFALINLNLISPVN